jgi:ribosomal protein S18 acetylase RimI-like enzyme
MDTADLRAVYVDAFLRRVDRMRGPAEDMIDADGVIGSIDHSDACVGGRLLVLDDRAMPTLRGFMPNVPANVVLVLPEAPECLQLVRQSDRYNVSPATAMVCRDLGAVPHLGLPAGLHLMRVRRHAGDPDGIPIGEAAAACLRAEDLPMSGLDDFVAYLMSLSAHARLFAAVDDAGQVRATAASGCVDGEVHAFFVTTDRQWRGRGVGSAMTALALHDARERGGVRACLDASAAGKGIYERLGFVAVTDLTILFGS